MEYYLTTPVALAGLRKKGYTEEFKLSGNDLLWVLRNGFVRVGNFTIVEFHKFYSKEGGVSTVFGILIPYRGLKGTMILSGITPGTIIPPVIVRKMAEMVYVP